MLHEIKPSYTLLATPGPSPHILYPTDNPSQTVSIICSLSVRTHPVVYVLPTPITYSPIVSGTSVGLTALHFSCKHGRKQRLVTVVITSIGEGNTYFLCRCGFRLVVVVGDDNGMTTQWQRYGGGNAMVVGTDGVMMVLCLRCNHWFLLPIMRNEMWMVRCPRSLVLLFVLY